MNILQVNYLDSVGGAARIAETLHRGYRAHGENSWIAVGKKYSDDPYIQEFPYTPPSHFAGKIFHVLSQMALRRNFMVGKYNVGKFLKNISEPRHYWNVFFGIEDYEYPGTWKFLEALNETVDIIHFHNLHGNYFDLRYFPIVSRHTPTVITMHDMWLLTGHCAHSFDCSRWKIGCGACPYLESPPRVNRDRTAYNLKQKKEMFLSSKTYVVSPSQWLIDKVQDSILLPATLQTRVIHNGINLSVFHPIEKAPVRDSLGISQDAFVLLFVAAGPKDNLFKDYKTIIQALQLVANRWEGQKLKFFALGGDGDPYHIGNVEIIFIPFVHKQETVAKYYQVADIYLHAARADTFPNVILEALACGTPVIATGVGGIPEQIKDGQTGFIIGEANYQAMAVKIIQLLGNEDLRKSMGAKAATDARLRFSMKRMVNEYLAYYEEIIQDWPLRKTDDLFK